MSHRIETVRTIFIIIIVFTCFTSGIMVILKILSRYHVMQENVRFQQIINVPTVALQVFLGNKTQSCKFAYIANTL